MYGAPTTARASRNILDDNDARPEAHRIRSGGILAIAHPAFSAGIQSTTHLCSGRMLVIEHACATYAAVYGVSSANHPPHRVTAATELASAVAHLVHAATKDHTPLIISGDVNAALAPILPHLGCVSKCDWVVTALWPSWLAERRLSLRGVDYSC